MLFRPNPFEGIRPTPLKTITDGAQNRSVLAERTTCADQKPESSCLWDTGHVNQTSTRSRLRVLISRLLFLPSLLDRCFSCYRHSWSPACCRIRRDPIWLSEGARLFNGELVSIGGEVPKPMIGSPALLVRTEAPFPVGHSPAIGTLPFSKSEPRQRISLRGTALSPSLLAQQLRRGKAPINQQGHLQSGGLE